MSCRLSRTREDSNKRTNIWVQGSFRSFRQSDFLRFGLIDE